MKHVLNLRIALGHLAGLGAIGAAVAMGLVSCEKQTRDSIGADKPASAPPTGPYLTLDITASKDTAYEMLCDVRTYDRPEGGVANRYGVQKAGNYHDYIPSPPAHCTAKIVSGPGPLKITIGKPGADPSAAQTMTITTPGDAGKNTLHVF